MDQNRPLTKREIKNLRRLEKLDRGHQERKQDMMKWLVLGIGSVLFIVFFGVLIFFAKQNTSQNEVLSLKDDGWVKGASSAAVTLVEFADFQCPACRAYHPIVGEVLKSYNGRLKFIFKHFPLTSSHPNAIPAGMAAEAAGVQGKFFEMHDLLYEHQSEWADLPLPDAREKFISYARELKLDEESFKKDLDRKDLEDKIQAQQEEGIKNGVNATPTFFIKGKIIQNPRSVDDFKKLIDKEINN